MSGATSALLSISPAILSDAGNYDVLVTNTCGTVPSNQVTVSLQSNPTITDQPDGVLSCSGNSVMLSVTADTVPPVTYRWRKAGQLLPISPPYSGVLTSTLTINPASELDSDNYDCVITDACGQSISQSASVTVSSSVPFLIFGPDPMDICAGQYVALGASAVSSPSPNYQWRKNGDPIPGATSSTLEFPVATAADTGSYDVLIYNGCGTINPPAVQLNVFAAATADGTLDATANGLDVPGLIAALVDWDFVTYSAPYCAYDMNGDAYVDQSDIPGAVAIMLGS